MTRNEITESEAKAALEAGARKVSDADVRKVLEREAEIRKKFESKGPLGRFLGHLKLLFGIVNDYWNGSYRQVPWYTIAAIIAALLYVLSPVDIIPDFIPIIGYVDDALVVAVCIKCVQADLDAYNDWKIKQP